jgi:hypothetical protein
MSLTLSQADDMRQENLLSGIYAREYKIAWSTARRRDWVQTLENCNYLHLREERQLVFLGDCPTIPGEWHGRLFN